MSESLQRLQRERSPDPGARDAILQDTVRKINQLLGLDIQKAVLGWRWDGRAELIAGGEYRSEYAYGNLRSLVFFSEDTFAEVTGQLSRYVPGANRYSFFGESYLDVTAGLGTGFFSISGGSRVVAQTPVEIAWNEIGYTNQAVLDLFSSSKKSLVGHLVEGAPLSEDEHKWAVELSDRAYADDTSKSHRFYALITPAKAGTYTVYIGTEEDHAEWVAKGLTTRIIDFEKTDSGVVVSSYDRYAKGPTWLNRMKLTGGATFRVQKDAGAPSDEYAQVDKETGDFRGWSAQYLVDVFNSNKSQWLAGVVYGNKKFDVHDFDQFQAILTANLANEETYLQSGSTVFYVKFDHVNRKLIVGDRTDYKSWGGEVALDVITVDVLGEADKWTFLLKGGAAFLTEEGATELGGGQFYGVAGAGFERSFAEGRYNWFVRGFGGLGPYPQNPLGGDLDIWDPAMRLAQPDPMGRPPRYGLVVGGFTF